MKDFLFQHSSPFSKGFPSSYSEFRRTRRIKLKYGGTIQLLSYSTLYLNNIKSSGKKRYLSLGCHLSSFSLHFSQSFGPAFSFITDDRKTVLFLHTSSFIQSLAKFSSPTVNQTSWSLKLCLKKYLPFSCMSYKFNVKAYPGCQ